ncbi:MAG: pyridoxal phosphate-dependent aminotransferase [Bacilli bacterium]|jgi:aromatic-amino-acid transaminase|nr:pyridoxal phosphate-dependent aminotransferase [Bacilli bacterium]
MARHIAKRAEGAVSSSDILKISAEARADKAAGHQVIDGSIGAFLNDDKTLGGISEIRSSLKEHITDDLSYPPILGFQEYKEAILKWLLKDEYEKASNDFSIPFGATLGGTGACSISFNIFLDRGEKVLLPDIMWGNYKLIASLAGDGYATYPLYDEKGGFGIQGIKKAIDKLAKEQTHVLLVINDPCQNPTGYCLKEHEYDELFSVLQEEGKKTILTVLFDIAYLDFEPCHAPLHPLFTHALQKGNSFLPCFAFSCSKTFGIYGLRAGALFAICEKEEEAKELLSSISSQARGIYSCPDGPALHAVAQAVNDPKQAIKLRQEISLNAEVLSKRGSLLKAALKENNIAYLPFDEGFFLTVKVEKAFKVAETLKAEHIFIVPLDDNHMRIALAGLNDEEINILTRKIKEAC